MNLPGRVVSVLFLFCLQWFLNGNAELISKISEKSGENAEFISKVADKSVTDPCSCYKSCPQQPSNSESSSVSSQLLYFYDSEAASCVEFPSQCVMNTSCVFSSKVDCAARCEVNEPQGSTTEQDQCQFTEYGCCPDGSLRLPDRKCPGASDSGPSSLDSANGDSYSVEVRWDLVASGLCVLVLLVAVLSVSGIMTYHYRERQKERIRSRYIHNVLEMYESGSESSDSEGGKERMAGGINQKDPTGSTTINNQLFAKV